MTDEVRMWHVTLTLAGESIEPLMVRNALGRLAQERPFLHSMKYASDHAEIQYWEEGETMLDAASLGLRLWNEHRETANLPRWEVVGLEVIERPVFQGRDRDNAVVFDLHDVTPLPF